MVKKYKTKPCEIEAIKWDGTNFKEVIKFTAMNMVRNENYPTLQKLTLVDEILGTCIKDFL